jgi:nucleoside-diphosphate-sugar epimerase
MISTNESSTTQDRQKPDTVGLIGATSFVGETLLPLLVQSGWDVLAFSRKTISATEKGITWKILPQPPFTAPCPQAQQIPHWICVAPIWVLPQYFPFLEACGARRILALSSTSRFTKTTSSDPEEQDIAKRLISGEKALQAWALKKKITWTLFQPTLIYGLGKDQNISQIVRVIRKLGFFPVLGKASGLRQPLHVEDLAQACLNGLKNSAAANKAYILSGSEIISYRDMVRKIFISMGRSPRILPLPLLAFHLASRLQQLLTSSRSWSSAMAERMNQDLTFSHDAASLDLDFKPRPFMLTAIDIPPQ